MKKKDRGYCLVSQQIRKRILDGRIKTPVKNLVQLPGDIGNKKTGWFVDDSLEERIQPSSFEPIIGNELFILDTEQSVFMSNSRESVYRTLLQLPKRQRKKADISNGFELKRGFHYLIPLEERIILDDGDCIRSSPKSSMGRIFPIIRMVTDYNVSFNETYYENTGGKEIMCWLLIQPTKMNFIIRPGEKLNQLRFLQGMDCSLSQQEIINIHKKRSLIYERNNDGSLSPMKVVITNDGLQISMDFSGKYSNGIAALRARDNPNPLDLSKKYYYKAEDYFEPILPVNGRIKFFKGERYLISSKGFLVTPKNLSSELRRHSGSGIRGEVDQAGFIDSGFEGDLVFEPNFNEDGGINLSVNDERFMSSLEFFRTDQIPDKIYGTKIGSHYQSQIGLRVSKHFIPFNFEYAAKEYAKLDREVLVHDANILNKFRKTRDGFEPIEERTGRTLINEIESNGFFHSRYDCETDEEVLQVIPYVLLFDEKNRIFTYERAQNIKDYGDERLFKKYSIGLGGHITRKDGPNFIETCLKREVMEEEVKIEGTYSKPGLVGTMMAYDSEVDRVHFGLIYSVNIKGRIKSNESSITSFEMRSVEELMENIGPFETWSKKLIPYLRLLIKS